MKRPDTAAPRAAGQSAGEVTCAVLRKYPLIMEYLVTDKYEDGSARDTSALAVNVRDGEVLVALNDKDLKQSAYTQARTLAEALGLLEGALRDGKALWRPWKSGKRK
jgi:hypothetical protein